MIRRPTCAGRLNATEPKFSQIEGRNEGVDHPNRIVICTPVIQAFRQQSRLPAISPLNEAPHAQPPPIQCGIIADTAFSHSQGHYRSRVASCPCPLPPKTDITHTTATSTWGPQADLTLKHLPRERPFHQPV